MENIYIDTSIFEGNNFLESRRINEILKLSEEGYIRIILPSITYHETKNRAIINIKGATSRFKKYRDETRVLRNIDSIKDKFNQINENALVEEFLDTFDKRLHQGKCLIIDYPTVNIKDVFDKYFKDEFPFSKGEKKHEFPDAFAILSVEMWCKENRTKCYVFSSDKDLLSYESPYLYIVESYEKFLDEKLREVEVLKQRQKRLATALELYEEEKENLEVKIKKWVLGAVDDERTYYRYTHLEVHNIDVEDYDASLLDFQIISITNYDIQIEAKARISFRVEIEVDDAEVGYYDDEEKEWHYLDTTTEIIEQEQIIPVLLKVDIPIAGDDYMDIEVVEINNSKDLSIKENSYG